MEKFDLLNDYLDGELAPEREQEFFLNMASDDELRGRMKKSLAVRSAIQSNLQTAPPVGTTAALFGRLGFSPAGAIGVSGAAGGGIAAFMGKYWQAGLIAALSVTVIILLALRGGTDSIVPEEQNVLTASGAKKSQPPISSSMDNQEPAIPAPEVRTVTKYVYVEVPAASIGQKQTKMAGNAVESVRPIGNFSSGPAGRVFNLRSESGDIAAGTFEPVQSIFPVNDFGLSGEGNFLLEIHGSQDWLLPAATVSPSKTALFNNYSVSAFYNVFDDLYAGIDIRRENFFQRFEGMDDLGIINTYEQQPNFTSYSLALRYYFLRSGDFGFFAQGAAGFNNAGKIGRGMLGMEYAPYPSIRFILGAGYDYFMYRHQERDYNSKKAGIKYGVSYRF